MRYLISFMLVMVLFVSGCVSTTTKVATDPGVTPTTQDTNTTVTPTVEKKSTVTMGELKAGLKYVQLSYDAINAALEKVKEYNLGSYNETIDKIQPYLTTIDTALTAFTIALDSSDDAAALTAYNLARPAITTIIKTGGPLLLKYLF